MNKKKPQACKFPVNREETGLIRLLLNSSQFLIDLESKLVSKQTQTLTNATQHLYQNVK